MSNNYNLLLERLESDSSLIVKEFRDEKKKLEVESVESSDSDPHRKGRSVMIIHFTGGFRLVYKPHGLKAEQAYQSFQEYISSHCKLDFRKFKIIDCGEYGWEEFVSCNPCNSENEVRNYYYRMGMLIFCNYILNVNDIHTENLIAVGEYPVVVDAETILDNKKEKEKRTGREKIYDNIHESVLYSGVLPFYKYSQNGKGINMSAINGKEGDEYPILIPRLKEIGKSNMHYEYERPVTQASKNLIKLGGKVISPYDYINEICNGFSDAYLYSMNNRELVLDYVNVFENIKVRHLVQDTQRYSMLLHTSYHPDFLQNGRDRQLFLCNILKNVEKMQGNIEVAKLEIKDMLNMDVPYFFSNTSKTNLYGSEGEKIDNYFKEPSIQHLKSKIVGLCEKDLENQLRMMRIISTDLNDITVEKPKKNMSELFKYQISDDPKNIKKEAALKIYNILEENAFYGDDNEDINWMGVTSIGNEGNSSWNIQPLGVYLYEGIGGIAIFYNALQKLNISVNLSKACEALDNTIFQYTKDMLERTEGLENESSGAFGGESSVIYIYEVLYTLTGKRRYLDFAEKHSQVLEYAIRCDKNNDIIYGNAGAIITLINLFHLSGKRKYLELACVAGDVLVENQYKGGWICGNGDVLSGFSHGTAGIVYALTKLNKERFKPTYQRAIQYGLNYENKMYVEKYQNWMDNREEALKQDNENNRFMAAWCHGAPGILLARSKMCGMMEDECDQSVVILNVKQALAATEKYGFTDNDCLCHGNLGNTEILFEYSKVFGNDSVRKKSLDARTKIATGILNDEYDCARSYLYGYKIPGFMTGISGMGYSLLRDICPELPCVLALEI